MNEHPTPSTLADIRPGASYTVAELYPLTRHSKASLYRAIDSGRLKASRPVGGIVILGADFLDYMASSVVRPRERRGEEKPSPRQSPGKPFKYVRVKVSG